MTEELINEMYLLAIKSKLQNNSISREEKLACIFSELGGKPEIVPVGKSFSSIPRHPDIAPIRVNEPKTVQIPSLKVTAVKYASYPSNSGFDNMELEDVDDGLYYSIQLTDDPSKAYFEFLTNEYAVEELKLTPDYAPSFAVRFENTLSGQSQLVKIKSGLLEKVGRMWKIVQPCVMKWE